MAATVNPYPSIFYQLVNSCAVLRTNFIAATTFSSTSLRVNHCARWKFLHLVFCSLHRLDCYRLVADSRKQANHEPTVGVGGIYNEDFVYC